MGLSIQLGGTYPNASSCFSYPPQQQVACSSQFLNLTEPPSEYDFTDYPFLWEPIACMLANVTYHDRVNVPDNFTWCSVPLAGSDAFLFAALALVCAACLFGKLSAVWVLIAGGVVGAVNNYANLLQVSNSISIWLGISPPDLFFYAFLPPLLVDSAIRIDFFMFSKLGVHIVLMAFVMVVVSAIVLTPLILFVLGFSSRGFTWVHGALFSAMIASTDALAATAILKQGGGPEKLVVLMEGEALLNDASAITLFEVFSHILEHGGDVPTVWSAIPTIIEETLKLASIGAGVGWGMSIATGYLLRWLRWRGARPPVEITVILAVAYLSFYVGQSPAKGSGVISVVVFGLWGNYTSKWGMLSHTQESGSFDAFWDTLSFASNGLVFFWAGVASINYFIRSIDILGSNSWSYAAVPLIYIFMMLIRTGCLAGFNLTFFSWVRERLSWTEVVFTGWSGLRGAISLIMTADFIAHSAFLQGDANNPEDPNRELDRVNSDIAMWTAAFVLLTLLINAPSISHVMHWLRLDVIAPEKQAMRAKAKRALLRFTGAAIETLREDDEEFLQGANWEAVSQYVDVSGTLDKFDPPPPPPPAAATPAAGPPKGGAGGGDGAELADGFGLKETASEPEPGPRAKSLGQSVQGILLSPFMAAASLAAAVTPGGGKDTGQEEGKGKENGEAAGAASAAAAAEEGAANGVLAAATSGEQSVRGQRGGLLGGLMRSTSLHQLALLGPGGGGQNQSRSRRRELQGRSRSHGRLERQSSRRSMGGRSRRGRGGGYASDSGGSESGLDESDTSSPGGSGYSSDFGSELSAGPLIDEVVEECPFIEVGRRGRGRSRSRDRRLSLSSDGASEEHPVPGPPPRKPASQEAQPAGAADQGQQGDIELGLRPSAGAEPAAAAVASAGAAAAGAGAAALDGQPAGGALGDDEMRPEDLAFLRQVQARQRQQSQHRRPALGSLFAAGLGPEGEGEGEGESSPPRGAAPGSTFRRGGSSSGLATITEHRQQGPEQQQQQGWLQQPAAAGAAGAARAGSEDLYYSSVPAELGRQLQRQLRSELHGGDAAGGGGDAAPPGSAAAGGESGPAAGTAGTAGTVDAAHPRHGRTSSGDELYYSSVPAVMGRRLQEQLREQLQATPQRPTAAPGSDADGEMTGAGDSPQGKPARVAVHAASAGSEPIAGAAGAGTYVPAGAPVALGSSPTAPHSTEQPGYYSSLPAAVGRQMFQQLQAELAATVAAGGTGAGGAEPPAPGSPRTAPPEGYYSSLPAVVGRRMAAQLQQERALAQEQEQQQQQQQQQPAANDVAAAPGSAPAEGYYSSLPAAAGRSLQRQLQQELAAGVPEEGPTQEAEQPVPPQAQRQQKELAEDAASATPERGAAAGGEVAAGAAYYNTMPAAMGRSLQQQLSQELAQEQPAPSSGSSRASSLEAGGAAAAPGAAARGMRRPPRPGTIPNSSSLEALSRHAGAASAAAGQHPGSARGTPRQAAARPAAHRTWENYHATVTGAAGPSLAAELQRQLQRRPPGAAGAPPGRAAVQRDLLGRRIGPSTHPLAGASSGGSAPGASSASSGELPSAFLPLSARGSLDFQHSGSPSAASVLPAATPLSTQLQMRRARTLDRSRRGPGSAGGSSMDAIAGAAVAAAVAAPGAGDAKGTARDAALARLQRRSGSWPDQRDRDTSWQHKPLRPPRSAGGSTPRLARTSATLAASAGASEAGSQGDTLSPGRSGGASAGVAGGMGGMVALPSMAPASVLLSRTYSGPAPSSLAASAKLGGASKAQRDKVLQRLSYPGSGAGSQEPSMHGSGAYALALMAAADGEAPQASGLSSPGFPGPIPGPVTAGVLSEMRSRLIAGLKRYFHAKRMEGLLSSQGLRILEYACDHAAEHTQRRLGLWQVLEAEVKGNLATRAMARSLMLVARAWRGAPRWLQAATSWPVKKMTGFLRRLLGRRMLVACEVAVEYYLSLIHSPQVQWMQQTDEAWPLQQEVEGEVDAAYRFIIDREIEAPDRFGAIQSYRAAMAVLRQQLTFVHELYESGMVDEGEKDDMLAPLDKRMRHLEITGPVWKPPRPRAVLRGLPFMQGVPDDVFKAVLRAGTIKEYRTGDVFWQASDLVRRTAGEAGPGAFVVLSGVIRRQHVRPDGTKKEYFQGIGGVVGALLSLTGTRLPGSDAAVAEGNTLGKGAMLFHLPQRMVHWLMKQAEAGDDAAAALRLQLLRLAGAYVVESCDGDVVAAVQLHLVHLAAARVERLQRRRTHRRSGSQASGGLEGASPRSSGLARASLLHGEGEEDDSEGEEEEGPAAGPAAGPRRSTSAHLQRSLSAAARAGAGAGDDAEPPLPALLAAAKQQLQQQQSPAPSGLRHAKSFGGQLAELMQQIAQEEFEGLGDRGHLELVEEGAEDVDVASPLASEATGSLAGGSAADLAGLAGAATAGGPAAGTANGMAPARLRRRSSGGPSAAEQLLGGGGRGGAHAARAARALRHQIKTAARRAPQYAAEVLADIRRSLPAAVALDLPPGATFRQSTHAVLLRGQLAAEQPPPAAADLLPSPPGSPRGRRSAGTPRAAGPRPLAHLFPDLGAAPAADGEDDAPPLLRRASTCSAGGEQPPAPASGWEAALGAAAAAAAAPEAPRLLPWLWSTRFRCTASAAAAKLHPEQEWRAGSEGALLLVCLTDAGSVPSGVEEALEAAAAAAAQHAAAAEAAAGLKSYPLDLGSEASHPLDGMPSGGLGSGGPQAGGEGAQRAQRPPAQLAPRPSGLMRLMPWQHRYHRSRPAPDGGGGAGLPGDGGSAAASSQEGSQHGGEEQARSLRLPLDRLASRSARPAGGAQTTR